MNGNVRTLRDELGKVIRFVIPILVFVLLVVPDTFAAAQEDDMCEIGDKKYSTLESAINDVRAGNAQGSITLLNDYEIPFTEQIADCMLTIDLAGHSLRYDQMTDSPAFEIIPGGVLQVKDSVGEGRIYSTLDKLGLIEVNGGHFILDSGRIEFDSDIDSLETAINVYSGELTVNGGEVNAKFPLNIKTTKVTKDRPAIVTIHGGNFNALTNCVIDSYRTGHLILTITGGCFNSIGGGQFDYYSRGMLVENYSNATMNIHITGGEFHGKVAGILWRNYDPEVESSGENLYKALLPAGYNIYLADGTKEPTTYTVDKNYVTTAKDVVIKAEKYQVSLQPNGGTVGQSNTTVTYDSSYGTLPMPTRTGYTFTGWYTSSTGGSKVTNTTKVTTVGNHTLYAHWKAVAAKISFTANGGSKPSKGSIIVTYGKKLGNLPVSKREKYVFCGWYTKRTGGTKVTASTIAKVTKATTVYAHWSKVNVTKASLMSLSSKAKKIALRIKQVSLAKGYQIVLATNSTFTRGVRRMYVSSNSKSIPKLRKGTYYYVKVRAYKYDSAKKKVYGAYSSVRRIKVK